MESSPEKDDVPLQIHLDILRKHFGHTAFRPMQWKIIRSVMEDKRDNCTIMATGYGKSLCYQYPAIFKTGLSLIISPLISLMEDQVKALEVANIPACYLGTAQTRNNEVIEKLMEGFYRLVYLTPEYACGESGMDLLCRLHKCVKITLLAIDEAHCVSQWGHDFRPAYKNLGKIRSVLPSIPVLAVTATATDQVKNDIIQLLALRSPQILSSGFDRPNLYFQVVKKSGDPYGDISKLLLHAKKMYNIVNGSVIIYCLTKKITETIADVLNLNNIKCHSYHAGLSIKTRKFVHEQFVKDEIKVLVATIAFGMGIDKPNVRCVIHYGTSSVMEAYYQEAGRAGRDGNPSLCILFHSPTDFSTHENLLALGKLSDVAKTQQQTLNRYMKQYISSRECRRHLILSYFDKNLLPPSSPQKNCCDNCTRIANTPKDSDRYEGIDNHGLYDFSEDTELFLNAIERFHPKTFGLGMIIALLKGSKAKKINTSYCTSPVYGAGASKSEIWWKQIAFLLEQEKFIIKERKNYGDKTFYVIVKDYKADAWLRSRKKGKSPPVLLKPTQDIVACLKTKSVKPMYGDEGDKIDLQQFAKSSTLSVLNGSPSSQVLQLDDNEEKLMNELMRVRHILAKTNNIMPYMVVSDTALQQMAIKRPLTLTQIVNGKFDGMSESKISKFGTSFVGQIKEFSTSNPQPVKTIDEILSRFPLPMTSVGLLPSFNLSRRESLSLFNEGNSLQEVAAIRKLETSTIINHLISVMKSGCKINIQKLIPAPKLKCIIDIIQSPPINKDMSKLGPIKNNCPPVIKYDEIKMAIAYLEVRNHLSDLNCTYEDEYSLSQQNGVHVYQSMIVSPFDVSKDVQEDDLSHLPSVADSILLNPNKAQSEVFNCSSEETNQTIDECLNTMCANDNGDFWEEDDLFVKNIDQLDKDMKQSIDLINPDICLDIEKKPSGQNLEKKCSIRKTTDATDHADEYVNVLHENINETNVNKRKFPDWITNTSQAKQIMKKKMAKNSLFN